MFVRRLVITGLWFTAALGSAPQALGSLTSPFPPSVEAFTIANTHTVGADNVVRGMAPRKKLHELVDFGVTDVLIFKKDTRGEVFQEIEELRQLGYSKKRIMHVPFKWSKIRNYQRACQQTVKALRLLRDVARDPQRVVFFHCTVGEDRTGHLSGLFRMLQDDMSMRRAFYTEMCARGYSRGNPNKPDKVVRAIRSDLTPLYVAMAKLIQDGELTLDNLDAGACRGIRPMTRRLPRCRPADL